MNQHIEASLIKDLKSARCVFIAVALVKDYGLEIIENNLPLNCKRKYLIGIDLPTPPKTLRKILGLKNNHAQMVDAKIFDTKENYHPKVYLIENISGELIAYVGSANATKGGFTHNIEMNVEVTDRSECLSIQNWFEQLFACAIQFDEEYIKEYEIVYHRNRKLATTQRSNLNKFLKKGLPVSGINLTVSPGQFFRQSDFDAFAPETHYDSDTYLSLRRIVKDRFVELSEMMLDKFKSYGISNLARHYRQKNYTSNYYHVRGSEEAIEAIWLHFGKSYQELQKYKGNQVYFPNHIRIQVILRNTILEAYIGIWLYIGQYNGSYYDRKHLKDQLQDENYVECFYEYLLDLGDSYGLFFGDKPHLSVGDIKNSFQLKEFLQSDDYRTDFIIARNYNPNDLDLSEENILETVMIEFSKLYLIYNLIKAPEPL